MHARGFTAGQKNCGKSGLDRTGQDWATGPPGLRAAGPSRAVGRGPLGLRAAGPLGRGPAFSKTQFIVTKSNKLQRETSKNYYVTEKKLDALILSC